MTDIQCYRCKGAGGSEALVCPPGKWLWVRCDLCDGTGRVTPERHAAVVEGERRRADRKRRGVGLREEARRLGITARQLSDIEAGRKA